MARPRRPLAEAERTRPCGFCGAASGERCANRDGSVYPGTHAARRAGNARPHENYPVTLCGTCAHPGGQHVVDKGCRLCRGCPGWDEGNTVAGHWNDQKTDDLTAEMRENGG